MYNAGEVSENGTVENLKISLCKRRKTLELTLMMRVRIAAAAAVGILLIGIFAWPLAAGDDSLTAVTAANFTLTGRMILVVLAIVVGFVGYFVSWPYGREIGILAVPAGLAVWSVRSASIGDILLQTSGVTQRHDLFVSMRWGPVFWMAIVAAGFFGTILATKICSKNQHNQTSESDKPSESTESEDKTQQKNKPLLNSRLNIIIAVTVSILITQLCIPVLAQGNRWPDRVLKSVVSQPSTGQIILAVVTAFGLAAFVVKKFLNLSYIWPTAAASLLTAVAVSVHAKTQLLESLYSHWPAVYFSNAILAILPIQIVTFAAIGSVIGYWAAVQYTYWQKHGS